MTLYSLIQNAPEQTLLFCNEERQITAKSIQGKQESYRNLFAKLRANKIALYFTCDIELAQCLTLFDGVVERITIIPSDIAAEQLAFYISKSESEFVLSDLEAHQIETKWINVHDISSDKAIFGVSTADGVCCDQTESQIQTQWVLFSSGTTGTPKLVVHSLASLCLKAKRSVSFDENVWGLVYRLSRFAGLQVFLQGLLSLNPIVFGQNMSVPKVWNLFIRQGVNCLSATPTLWRKFLMGENAAELDLKQITLGGEISDQAILDSLAKTFSNAKIRHIYASTETGVGFSVDDKKAGFPLHFIESGHNDNQYKMSSDQTLLVRSSSCAQHYLGNEDIQGNDGFVDTGDLISIKNERVFFMGRANGSINVGGNKVMPEQVEKILLNYPGLAMAKVSAKHSPITGKLVQAHIVLNKTTDKTKPLDKKSFLKELRRHCSDSLPAHMVPAFITVVDEIALNANGKINRNG